MRGYLLTLIWCGQLKQRSLIYLRISLFLFTFVLNSKSFNGVFLKKKKTDVKNKNRTK